MLLALLLLLLLGPRAPAAAARPCAASPLCVCRGDHFACDRVPFHRFPDTDVGKVRAVTQAVCVEAGARHVSLSAARLGVLREAALDARALRTLVIVDSKLHHIEPRALQSMSSSLASLDLGYNEFTELPLAALRPLAALHWLNLQNNYIGDIEPGLEWGGVAESLSTLSLSGNQLVTLRAGAFTPLRRLARLELDGNRLRHVAPAALPAALALLRLADNLLPELPCALLLPRLAVLALRNNALRRFASACDGRLARLDSLDLSHNELADDAPLEPPAGLQLRRLALDLNRFTDVPPLALRCGRLEHLSLSHNALRHVSPAAVRALRRSLRRLELDHNALTELPAAARDLHALRRLSAAHNRLERIAVLPPHLHSLNLAGNFLTTLPAALRDLAPATLRDLDLGYNRISHVAPDDFSTWAAALHALSLRGNLLARLAPGAFPPLPLRELLLGFNELRAVAAHAFANLTRLRALELSAAALGGRLAPRAYCETLASLSADNGVVRIVSSDDLLNFPSLEYLNLDFNELVEFPSRGSVRWANVSSRLKELRLSYNRISAIDSSALTRLSELRGVELAYNRLRGVGERGFAGLPDLVYLNLAGNVVEQISDEAFVDLPKLQVLNLQENNLAELSTGCFLDVSDEDAGFTVNVSANRIMMLRGGRRVAISVIDLSHNLLASVSREFVDALGEHVRRIVLSHNRLLLLDALASHALPRLAALELRNNSIGAVRRRAFADTPALQALDLADNLLVQLAPEQFVGAPRLRLLRLDGNRLSALPRDAFKNTLLEYLDLGGNRLTSPPAAALAHVGFTLRRLELARNRVERLDAAALRAVPELRELSLACNALGALPDDALAALAGLRRLDLAHNLLEADFRELLLRVPRLRSLSLAGVGLRSVPSLPLADLTELSLSDNLISAFAERDVRRLARLRALDLAGNRLAALRPAMWAALPRLAALDVSRNPVARLPRGCFAGLARLLHLRMEHLAHLEALDPRAFVALRSLRSLALETPTGRTLEVPLAEVAAALPQLEALALRVRRETLDTQLRLAAPKLRALELRGAALERVEAGALSGLGASRALALRLAGTRVAALPAGLLLPLARVSLSQLDLSHNRLRNLGPAPFYANYTDWRRLATKLLPGGLVVAGNPLRCSCARWAGRWLRRWTSEVGGAADAARDVAQRSDCVTRSGAARALLALPDDDEGADCRADPLAGRAPTRRPPLALLATLLAVGTGR